TDLRRACPAEPAARAEDPEGARVSVQERLPLHRSDLAVAEEAAHRDVAQVPAKQIAVVVRPAVEVRAAAEAREEDRALGARRRVRAVAGETRLQVLRRRPRVAQMELDDLGVV